MREEQKSNTRLLTAKRVPLLYEDMREENRKVCSTVAVAKETTH